MGKYGDEAPPRERRSKRNDRKKEDKKDEIPEAATLLDPQRPPADGVANAEPSAATTAPLLVRADGDPGIGLQSDNPKRKPKRKPRLQSATSALRLSRSRSQRQDSNSEALSEKKESTAIRESPGDVRVRQRQRAAYTQTSLCGISSVWAFLANSTCVRGSLRQPVSTTELPPLSTDARAKIQSLDTATRKSHMHISVLHTDSLPTVSNSRSKARPVVVMHLVSVCSGRPIEQQHQSPPAAITTLSLDELAWNSSHTWLKTPLKEFLTPDVLVLIEIIQPSRRKTPATKSPNRSGQAKMLSWGTQGRSSSHEHNISDPTHHKRLAWCFFKPVSDSGNIRLTCVSLPDIQASNGSTQRLQLFAWQRMSWLDLNQARTEYRWDSTNSNGVPAVFLQYQKRIRVPLPCSLHVQICPVASAPEPLTPRRLSGIKEDEGGRVHGDEGLPSDEQHASPDDQLHHHKNQEHESNPSLPPQETPLANDPLLKCKRQIGEPCIVPQRVLHRIPTGRRGCSCLAFSPDGLLLAAAVHHVSATAEEWLIHIHQVNTGVLWQSCRGHQSIIYSLEWGLLSDGKTKGLISASSDSAALLWLLRESQPASLPTQSSPVTLPYQVLQHVPAPVFVYCAIFHTSQPHLIVTGSSDGLLRVWNINPVSPTPAIPATSCSSRPQLQWKVSNEEAVAVHSVRMEAKASGRLFCGDSHGNITVWTPAIGPDSSPTSYELSKTVRTGQRSVTSLFLHPRKQHMLVLAHPHALLQYELRSFLLLHKNYTGVECNELLVHAAFSPDGQFVVSGSEDGVPHLFHSVSGQRLDTRRGVWGQRFFHGFPLMEIAWSPSSHVVAMAAYGENHPVVVLCGHHDDMVSATGFQTAMPDGQGSSSSVLQRKHRSSSDVDVDVKSGDGIARAQLRADPAAEVSSGKHIREQNPAENPEVANDRVQRALQRRQQRLEAKLAREAAEAQAANVG